MQVAARFAAPDAEWRGTEIAVELDESTGLYLSFAYHSSAGKPVRFLWGDGAETAGETADPRQNRFAHHTYPASGRYVVRAFGVRSIGFRILDGQDPHDFDRAVVSLVDYAGQIVSGQSGSFRGSIRLERFVAPACVWQGQRDFAGCTSLREVVIGRNSACYDSTYDGCTSLVSYRTLSTGTCWRKVWNGCSAIRELDLGRVDQLGPGCFAGCASLADIRIAGKTVEQIAGVAPRGNIVSAYESSFPWGAGESCRFHGSNGHVLGNGLMVHT